MNDERDVAHQVERFEERIEIGNVVLGIIGIVRRCARMPMGDEVGRNDSAHAFHMGHDIAPKKGRCRVAVEKDEGVAFADIDIGHLRVANRDGAAERRVSVDKVVAGSGVGRTGFGGIGCSGRGKSSGRVP
jgi:hypothetical protein